MLSENEGNLNLQEKESMAECVRSEIPINKQEDAKKSLCNLSTILNREFRYLRWRAKLYRNDYIEK